MTCGNIAPSGKLRWQVHYGQHEPASDRGSYCGSAARR